MTIEADLEEIKNLLLALNKKLDTLIEVRETLSLMFLSERALKKFLEEEPDVYSLKDLKVKYH
ncbi:MAG: hypothetical protein ACP5KW_08765 [Thermoproteota archaeon]